MTEEELSNYRNLRRNADDIYERLIKLGYGVTSIPIKEVDVSSSKIPKSIQEKITELEEIWIEARLTALEQATNIVKWIESIDDQEVKIIARYKYIDLLNWTEIGEKMHCDRTTASKKMRTYLKLSHTSHSNVR